MSGMVLVNILTVITLPIITRIYSPEAYGSYQAMLALILTLGAVSTLRYEMSIVLPKKDISATSIVRLSVYILLGVTFLYYILTLFFHNEIAKYFHAPEYAAWLLPLLIFLTAIKPIYLSWYSRTRQYGLVSKNNVWEQLINRPLMILFGWLSPSVFSLIAAYMLSKIFTTINLVTRSKIDITKFKKKLLGHYMKEYKKFPLFLTPATFANTLAAQAPMLLLGLFFNAAVVGYYSVVQRLVNMPMSLMQQSMSQVYYERAAKELNEKGNAASITLKTIAALSGLAVVGAIFLYFLGNPIIKIFLGKNFHEAATYLVLLIPWFVFRFIKAPINYWELINRQEMTLGLHFFQLALIAAIFWIFHSNARETILAFSLAMGAYYLINIMFIVFHCLKVLIGKKTA
jgi:O-antigen/teichoic acid export membrane protein